MSKSIVNQYEVKYVGSCAEGEFYSIHRQGQASAVALVRGLEMADLLANAQIFRDEVNEMVSENLELRAKVNELQSRLKMFDGSTIDVDRQHLSREEINDWLDKLNTLH